MKILPARGPLTEAGLRAAQAAARGVAKIDLIHVCVAAALAAAAPAALADTPDASTGEPSTVVVTAERLDRKSVV